MRRAMRCAAQIPFKKNDTAKVNPATLDAMNVFVNDAIESGAYGNAAKIYFPEARLVDALSTQHTAC